MNFIKKLFAYTDFIKKFNQAKRGNYSTSNSQKNLLTSDIGSVGAGVFLGMD